MLKPPDEFEPIIGIPFAGVMSETIGAALAGFKHIIAIEMDEEYCAIGKARLEWWTKWMKLTTKSDPGEIRKLAQETEENERQLKEAGQLSLFDT